MTEGEKKKLLRMEHDQYRDMREIARRLGRNNIDFERARGKWLGIYEVCCKFGLGDEVTDEK